jgi:hypothetical protein
MGAEENKGCQIKRKLKAAYIWQMATRYLYPVNLDFFFMAFLCVSHQGEFKNTIIVFGEKSMSKAFCRKTFFLPSFPIDFF